MFHALLCQASSLRPGVVLSNRSSPFICLLKPCGLLLSQPMSGLTGWQTAFLNFLPSTAAKERKLLVKQSANLCRGWGGHICVLLWFLERKPRVLGPEKQLWLTHWLWVWFNILYSSPSGGESPQLTTFNTLNKNKEVSEKKLLKGFAKETPSQRKTAVILFLASKKGAGKKPQHVEECPARNLRNFDREHWDVWMDPHWSDSNTVLCLSTCVGVAVNLLWIQYV